MRKIIIFGLFLMLLMPVMAISEIEKTYILTPEKNAIKITFPVLSKEYNLKDEALKDGITSKDLCKVEKTIYKGDGIIALKAYQNITKQKIKSSYDCNCKNIEKEIINNKTGEKKTEIIKVCDTCYIYENYIVSELIEINPATFKINKDTEIYEVFDGCAKIEELPNGKFGYSVWTDVNILGVKIKGATWWNSSWNYKQEINLSNTAGVLTDYQVKITLNTTNFNCSHANTAGKDIRFTNSSDDSLDYWIESWNASGDSELWVKINSLANATNTSIYMYFGNSEASSESNGTETFLLFDEFTGNTLDSILWDTCTISSGTVTQDEIAKLNSVSSGGEQGAGIFSKYNFSKSDGIFVIYDDRIQPAETTCGSIDCGGDGFWVRDSTATRDTIIYGAINVKSAGTFTASQSSWKTNNKLETGTFDNSASGWGGDYTLLNSTDYAFSALSTYKITHKITSDGYIYVYVDDVLQYEGQLDSTNWDYIEDDIKIEFYHGSYQRLGYKGIDNVRVGKYAATEPLYIIGNEESGTIYPTLNVATYSKRLYFYPERRFYYQ